MKSVLILLSGLLLSLSCHAYSNTVEGQIALNNGDRYNIEINEKTPSQMVRIQYGDLLLGELVEKRMIQESLNNLCKKKGQYLNPKATVCTSPLNEESSCFGVCSQDSWTPPWNIISDCVGCGNEVRNVDIIGSKRIKGKILLNKETYSPIVRIVGKINKANLPGIKKVISNSICRDEYHMNRGAELHCGESYDIKYGQCNSSYEFYSQCIAYCK